MKLFSLLLVIVSSGFISCHSDNNASSNTTAVRHKAFVKDSLQVVTLLHQGDSIYSLRDGLSTIAQSMLYFDSANRIANRIGDTPLLANTLYFIGNVYNAWNKEPATTIAYYQHSSDLYSRLPQNVVRAYYVRQMIAHAYDSEKANDTVHCLQTLRAAYTDLIALHDSVRIEMNFLSDFALIATNAGGFALADSFLQNLSPRNRIYNDPESNNYLDHYYLAQARLAIFGRRAPYSSYLDSLQLSLQNCRNRYDSAYYSRNLSALYEGIGQPAKGLYFARLSDKLREQVGQNDVLSVLRHELLDRQVQAGRERELRIEGELQRRNLAIIGGITLFIFIGFTGVLFQRRQQEIREKQRQQNFTKLLLQKEETERRRIATDLHDGINHELLALKNNIILQQQVCAEDVEGVIASVREVSRNLYPAMFESVGLTASIESLCQRFTHAGFFTTCDLNYTACFSKEEELQVYRIIQESLNNVAKHAKAEAARINVWMAENRFFLEIKDNGSGFDTVKVFHEGSSFGLQSIRERSRAIGAFLTVNSNNTGTVILLTKDISA